MQRLKKFHEFLKEKEANLAEIAVNRSALDFDRRLAQFNARFSDPKDGEKVIQAAGYASIGEFLSDPDDRKWNRLKIPGQQNYVDRKNHPPV